MPPTRSSTAVRTKTPRKPPVASSSKVTLDADADTRPIEIPPAEYPETLTPQYTFHPWDKGAGLDEDQRARLIHELVGFDPRSVCKDITESARREVYATLDVIENWARQISGNSAKAELELTTGLVALETLLESHIDKAFDKFTAWVLRNAFEFSPELDPALPWQKGLDFSRGDYVASQPNGQQSLDDTLGQARTKVEQSRLLAQKLNEAERVTDRRLEIAKQRRAEVGFVKEIIESAGLSPLTVPSEQLLPTIKALHEALQPLEPISLSGSTSFSASGVGSGFGASIEGGFKGSGSGGGGGGAGNHAKAWEMGRAAYLNWALNKIVRPTEQLLQGQRGVALNPPGGGAAAAAGGRVENERLEGIERAIEDVVDDKEGIERAMGNV
ncbi:hypothetical protein IAU59_007464 [Kwoniella sp. CBS 9459]